MKSFAQINFISVTAQQAGEAGQEEALVSPLDKRGHMVVGMLRTRPGCNLCKRC